VQKDEEYGGDVKNTEEKEEEIIIRPTPHAATPTLETIADAPTILLSVNAYRETSYIIEACDDNEVGWLGTVKEIKDKTYLIENVFLFEQKVSSYFCEFDQKGLGRFYTKMIKGGNKSLVSSILFWGHLHPGNMTDPSVQDDDQMDLFAHNTFFIRGIFTRLGKCVFTFFDYKRGLKIIDCPWNFYVEEDEARCLEIQKEMKAMVHVENVQVRKKSTFGDNWNFLTHRDSPGRLWSSEEVQPGPT
jgi:hypothetical protein